MSNKESYRKWYTERCRGVSLLNKAVRCLSELFPRWAERKEERARERERVDKKDENITAKSGVQEGQIEIEVGWHSEKWVISNLSIYQSEPRPDLPCVGVGIWTIHLAVCFCSITERGIKKNNWKLASLDVCVLCRQAKRQIPLFV